MPLLLALACGGGSSGDPPAGGPGQSSSGSPAATRPAARTDSTAPFSDVTEEVGLEFVHYNGMHGELYLFEMMGPGAALFDYDNDGDLDLFIVQGYPLQPPGVPVEHLFEPPRGPLALVDRLFRNDLSVGADGTPVVRFADVTQASGIDSRGYGQGVTTGDYDNDGWIDLYVTNWGPNEMWHNNGDGTFSEVTTRTGTEDDRWSVGAAFVDYDRDGWLDLYVGNYLYLTYANNKECMFTYRDYCNPKAYGPVPDRLLRNRGDGTFEDVTARSQVASEYGAALGIVIADLNLDGWIDIYVANDGLPNQCWINRGDGTFENTALLAGAALSVDGAAEASMGLDAGDFDNDGDEDLFMSHLMTETNTLYVNDGTGLFEDRTLQLGLAVPSKAFTGFGTGWVDFDNDGWLDLLVVNGAVIFIEEQYRAGEPLPLRQRNHLFQNAEGRRFEDLTQSAGPPFAIAEVTRAAAFGDVDNDGDTDVLITNNNGRARLLRNVVGNRNHWLGLRLVGGDPLRDMLGAWVELAPAAGPRLWRRVRAAASYASANDPRILFGLGERQGPVEVRATWPSGRVERWTLEQIDRWQTLIEGSGDPAEPPS